MVAESGNDMAEMEEIFSMETADEEPTTVEVLVSPIAPHLANRALKRLHSLLPTPDAQLGHLKRVRKDPESSSLLLLLSTPAHYHALNPSLRLALEKDLDLHVEIREVCNTAEEAVRASDVIFTQTPGSKPVLEHSWLKPHATIIASGSDQPTKNEIPPEVQAKSKIICDLVRQCSRLGELRTGIASGLVKESDVHAEIGEVVSGKKKGREGDELILVDLTGTGAQDAAIGQVAWDILSAK
ncbi:hypothetical protein NSK_008479 [Nannochloropsis salina CCMP1776]|uniref:Uncharacterized protein n=1 Tax=Nannochloropsis salina CCMP1776 TaxID=1027361 RepID=A0A4D9CRN1_9STRA|nr:hypothetical protein NSK_008479 [Nannochloropsis salina CCMP1776]|eukprot:TFJ80193.1 hypothetical protein NSK_008479 [Nannochloropsis salina CCMP1776]